MTSDKRSVQYTYDAFGRLASATDGSGRAETFTRDALGRVTNETQTVFDELFWTNRTAVLDRPLDAFGRPAGLSLKIDGDFSQSVRYTYGTDGRMDTITLTNAQGRSVSVGYDWEQGRFVGCTVFSAAGSPLFIRTQTRALRRPALVTAVTNAGVQPLTSNLSPRTFSYAYDAVGRPVSRNADAFAYNARGEVTNAMIDSAAWSYAYDHIGNRTTASDSAGATAYAANAVNQYTAVGAWTPSYDLDGNLQGDGSLGYAWDAAGRLASARDQNAWRGDPWWSFEYDHRSRRVMKRNWTVLGNWSPPDGHSVYFYDGWNLVHEIRVSGSYQTSHVDYFWGPDLSGTLQRAGGVGGLVAVSVDGDFYFPGYDNNGNVVGYWDESGSLVAEYAYDAFGNTISSSGSMASVFPHRFSTKYYDAETDLYYYGYRYYSPSLGRWISRDPIEERGGSSLYCMCGNKPLFSLDTRGLKGVTFLKMEDESNVPVVTVDDIPTLKMVDTNLNGTFAYYNLGKPEGEEFEVCFAEDSSIFEIRFRLGILIADWLLDKQKHESGEWAFYAIHYIEGDEMGGGLSPNPIAPATYAHERGHARAFLEEMKTPLENGLSGFFSGQYITDNKKKEVKTQISKKVFSLMKNQSYLKKSAEYANQATVDYYDNEGSYEPQGPQLDQGEWSDDGAGVLIRDPQIYDYSWKKL